MSGGSYNYLCFKDATDLLSRSHDAEIQQMADRLAALGYDDAAQMTTEVLLVLKQSRIRIEARIQFLSDVWHAIEWLDSCDISADTVEQIIKEWRNK